MPPLARSSGSSESTRRAWIVLPLLLAVTALLMVEAPTAALAPSHGSPLAAIHPGVPAGAAALPTAGLAPHPRTATAGSWVNLTGALSNSPSQRYIAAMAYDALDGYVLLFGGYSSLGSTLGDTWAYQNGSWTDLSGNQLVSPGARYAAAMTYDGYDHQVVMFGGYDSAHGNYYDDTWVFSNGTWANISANQTTHPSARWRAQMAYDANDGYVVLFGGTDSGGNPLSDTWKFVNDRWSQITNATGSPQGRYRFAMTYDAHDKEVVAFGGCTNTGSSCGDYDTWTYANYVWKNVTSTTHPAERVYMAMEYDAQLQEVVLFGGSQQSGSGTVYNDTWAFSAGAWSQLTNPVAPSPRGYLMMTYDAGTSYLVLFGGQNNVVYYSDTWTYGPKIVVWGAAQPPAIDVGQSTSINVTVVTRDTGLSYSYSGLPPGCTTQNSTGWSCTPTASGLYQVNATVNSSSGDTSSTEFSLLVTGLPSVRSVTATPALVTVGIRTSITVNVAGGAPPLSYAYPRLPPGCGSSNANPLSCAPTSNGTFEIEVVVTDSVGGRATGFGNLSVNPRPTLLELGSRPAAVDLGQTAELFANVSGGTAPYSYAWSGLPAGCVNRNASPLPCTPAIVGTSSVGVRVTDAFGVSVSGSLNLTVNPTPTLNSADLLPASVDSGVPVTAWVNVTGGTVPYNYTFVGAPAGCTFAISPHVLGPRFSCTPTGAGDYTILVKVTDGAGFLVEANLTLSVRPLPTVKQFTASPGATDVGLPVQFLAVVENGTGPYTYAYTGLPTGCVGAVQPGFTCTPSASGNFTVQVDARDAWGKVGIQNLTLLVNPSPQVASFVATPASLAPGGTAALAVGVSGGTAPYSYAFSGLPGGCTSANASQLNCTPSGSGTFTVVVTVTDAVGASATGNVTLTVTSTSGQGTFLGLPAFEGYGLIAAIAVVVVVAALLLMRRRRAGPPPEAAPSPDGSAADGSEAYAPYDAAPTEETGDLSG